MLFYGPPGTGKTSTILALAKELYGPEMFKTRVLELNASDERGISIVREKVKDFARMQLSNPPPHYQDKYPCPPYKIIILDEADSMTQDAQSALRRTMETYSKITRFCLICNYVTRIIDPLASRCSKFRFKMLDQENTKKRLEDISENEGVKLESGAIETLIKCSEGDLRKAITFLQSAARLVGVAKVSRPKKSGRSKKRRTGEEDEDDEGENDDAMDMGGQDDAIVTTKSIEEIAGVIPDNVVNDLIQAMQPRAKGIVYEAVAKVVLDMVADGWSAMQIVTQVCRPSPFSFIHADPGELIRSVTALPADPLRRHHPEQAEKQDRHGLLRGRQATGRWRRRASRHPRSGAPNVRDSRRTLTRPCRLPYPIRLPIANGRQAKDFILCLDVRNYLRPNRRPR